MSPRTSTLEPARGAPRDPSGPDRPRGWGGDGDRDAAAPPPASPASIAVWLLVGAITILFAAFTSTFLARRGEADWRTGPLPSVLWLSTAVLLASSLAIEWARRGGRKGQMDQVWTGLVLTAGLGLAFLGTQLLAWRQLVSMGVYLTTNPHSAFFYLLTAMHGLHLLGGLWVWCRTTAKVWGGVEVAKVRLSVELCTVYWHYLLLVWLVLFALLSYPTQFAVHR